MFDSNGKRPDGMMSTFAEYCLFLSHLISPSPCEGDVLGPLLEGYNVPAGQVHAEGRLQVKTRTSNLFLPSLLKSMQQSSNAWTPNQVVSRPNTSTLSWRLRVVHPLPNPNAKQIFQEEGHIGVQFKKHLLLRSKLSKCIGSTPPLGKY